MSVLVVALYAEGSTDNRFLPPIIQRTAERIIAQDGQGLVDVSEPMIMPKDPSGNKLTRTLPSCQHNG
jgi:hypothetical protein